MEMGIIYFLGAGANTLYLNPLLYICTVMAGIAWVPVRHRIAGERMGVIAGPGPRRGLFGAPGGIEACANSEGSGSGKTNEKAENKGKTIDGR